jgi:hypothetical protein
MLKRAASVFVLGAITAVTTAALTARPSARTSDPGLTVHEWGTFTTVAGESGRAIEWLPLGGPTDLPCFVDHYQNGILKVTPGGDQQWLDYDHAKAALWGKVRMETPVIYFYSPKDVNVNVSVHFPRGLITEVYPSAISQQTIVTPTTLRDPNQVGSVEWRNVFVGPSVAPEFPSSEGASHYYAARATDASPVQVGVQHEKFLFYRGVAGFDPPISTNAMADGSVEVTNDHGADAPLQNVVLFENRGGKIGYRVNGPLVNGVTMRPLTRDASLPALKASLAAMLVDAGLNEKEAAAMVDTWRDSWFEEGSRVFYILPRQSVDAILPLRITPVPSTIARVFVGRQEVITPTTIQTVRGALAANDTVTLLRYARFLSPIADRIAANGSPMERAQMHSLADAVFAQYVNRVKGCQ